MTNDYLICTICLTRVDTQTRGAVAVPLPGWDAGRPRVCSACRTVALSALADRYGAEVLEDGETRAHAVAAAVGDAIAAWEAALVAQSGGAA
jgi:hypothetical protein